MKLRFSPKLLAVALASTAAALPLHAEDVQGVVLAVKQVSVSISSSEMVQEVIKDMLVKEGDTVKEGQPMVLLQDEKSDLAVQEGQRLVENAEFQAKGTKSLWDDKMGSKEQWLKAKTELELAKIRLAAAELHNREKTIRAPLSGIVVKKYKEAGESVDRVEKLIDIVNIDQVYVQCYVSPKLLPQLKEGSEVPVRIAEPINAKFIGKIDFVAPTIDASSGLLRVKVLIDNPDHVIKAGLKGIAEFGK